jgi:hypothetical protein
MQSTRHGGGHLTGQDIVTKAIDPFHCKEIDKPTSGITAGVPFVISGVAAAGLTVVMVTSIPFKMKIIDWWFVSGAGSGTIKITDGTSDIGAATTCSGVAAVIGGLTVVAATATLAKAATLKMVSTGAGAGDVYVMAVRVA